jgi:hypothetical protein
MAQLSAVMSKSSSNKDLTLIYSEFIDLPNGMRMHSDGLLRGVIDSGLDCEIFRPSRHAGGRTHVVVDTAIAEAVKTWVLNSSIDDGFITGFAGLPLADYLRRMFKKETA